MMGVFHATFTQGKGLSTSSTTAVQCLFYKFRGYAGQVSCIG